MTAQSGNQAGQTGNQAGSAGNPAGNLARDPAADRARIDKWLWAARFYKTRAQAAVAIKGGKVQLNGVAAKRSKLVKAGDVVNLSKGPYAWEITVVAISERRGPPAAGQALWQESPESAAERERIREERARERELLGPPLARPRKGRPTKRDRRLLARLKE